MISDKQSQSKVKEDQEAMRLSRSSWNLLQNIHDNEMSLCDIKLYIMLVGDEKFFREGAWSAHIFSVLSKVTFMNTDDVHVSLWKLVAIGVIEIGSMWIDPETGLMLEYRVLKHLTHKPDDKGGAK